MSERDEFIARWARDAELSALEVDCAVTLMLKIIDGKCKMNETDKVAMATLYDQLRERPGERLDSALRGLIAETRGGRDEARRMEVYEQRLLAETIVSRPVMKAWKARLREAGVL